MEIVESFLESALSTLKREETRERAQSILTKWAEAWQGSTRRLTLSDSNHGTYLHFNQLIGGVWCKAFTFHATPGNGLSLRGPDTDRTRKSHKLRSKRLDSGSLDKLFEAWSTHPEARPAGNAVILLLDEAHDDVWESFLHEALSCLNNTK
ncbi:MAG: hypothetical protein FWG02_00985 [Holophagaceae bacterium]|nr:hypothetical protein [Holophagaceae bacterium]